MPTPGIGIVSASPAGAAQIGVAGIIVMRVQPNSPAAQAGLQGADPRRGEIGDIIVAVNGQPVNTVAALSTALESIGIGRTATLRVEHNGQQRQVKVGVVDVAKL